MQEHDISFVRAEMLANAPPPASERGIVRWLRINMLATPADIVLTLVGLLVVLLIVPPFLNWALFSAVWTGPDRSVCATLAQGGIQPEGWSGACWAFVGAKFEQFMFGRYPIDERWRVMLVAGLFVALLTPLLIPKVPRKGLNAIVFFGVFPIASFFLLVGGIDIEMFPYQETASEQQVTNGVVESLIQDLPKTAYYFDVELPYVETSLWGGLLVTLVLSFVGISVSLPLGIILALGRRSKMPVVKMLCVIFIEAVRGVPLVTVLFMASVMFPLFLPAGVNFDKFLRALVGVSLFASAYMAEVIRGGLQAIPKGQYEGADSLGLGYWQKMNLIVLPQALKLVIPGIVNTFIGLFKDTSLVSIIGMFDLLGIVRQNFSDAAWASPQTPMSGLVFAGFVFWIFCFGMSRYSIFMERRLDTGHKR
ncbi:amino acid ABC transporter permease [Aquibium sp. ELW1220]|uniref:amino acid ABC transporter permease n=1 Tax=Aquibium sp. ELW1220 TaxID=2976766 RepID=UPI0025B095EB|nr:amino acid ABC transporter permease [Aquibium sp. ELW1220]MDN2583854.1 amino acid ABC transporter permease [Aquibium sp. ELW1220]